MDFFAVLDMLIEQLGAFQLLGLLVGVSVLYYAAFRAKIRSVLDPLAYVLIFSSFTIVFLVILLMFEIVSVQKFAFAAATLALYYGAFLLTADRSKRVYNESYLHRRLGITPAPLSLLFLLNTFFLGVTYVFFGIPLFLESRLSLWIDAGGFGVIGRFTDGLQFVSLLLGMMASRQKGSARRWGVYLVLQFIVASILSGSKGSLLSLLFAWYLSEVRRCRTWNVSMALTWRWLVVLALLLALPLLTISIQSGGDPASGTRAIALYATRIAAEGDGYVYFFGGNLIDNISKLDYLAILRPMLAGLRLVPASTAINPGFEVMSQVLSVDAVAAGPNSRLPIYLLYFYGAGGIVLSPFLGMLLGYVRNRTVASVQRSPYRYAVMASVYLLCSKLEVDPQITVNGLFDLALVLPLLYFVKVAGEALRLGHRPRRRVSARRLSGWSGDGLSKRLPV